MIKPFKIRIDTMYYNVSEESRLIVDSKQADGCIDYKAKEIKINPDTMVEPQEWNQTVWHEVIHGIMHERDLSFKETSEETLVNELSKSIRAFIIDNPVFIEGYYKSEKK